MTHEHDLDKQIMDALIKTINDESNTSMSEKYNVYDDDALPDDLRDLLNKRQEKIWEDELDMNKIMLPKKEMQRKQMEDQLDAMRKAMDMERRKYEQNDPVQRELRDLRNEVEHLKDAMRKFGILLDTDLPDSRAFEEFKMLREAYKKYKMVEKLVLGEDDGR